MLTKHDIYLCITGEPSSTPNPYVVMHQKWHQMDHFVFVNTINIFEILNILQKFFFALYKTCPLLLSLWSIYYISVDLVIVNTHHIPVV